MNLRQRIRVKFIVSKERRRRKRIKKETKKILKRARKKPSL